MGNPAGIEGVGVLVLIARVLPAGLVPRLPASRSPGVLVSPSLLLVGLVLLLFRTAVFPTGSPADAGVADEGDDPGVGRQFTIRD